MASAWFLHVPFCDDFPFPARTLSCEKSHRLKKYNNRLQVMCCESNENHHRNPSLKIQYDRGTQRRQILFQSVLAAFSFPAIVSAALADNEVTGDFRLYSDEANKFKIMIPQDWQVGLGDNNGIKSVTGFFPEEASSSNVTVVITGLGADFTRLESFGKVDAFAENLVSGLDRSWQRPAGVAAKLIDSKAANGLYYIEYTLQNSGESRRHLFSVLGIANNGWYNRLYTVTGQFADEDSRKYGSKIEKVLSTAENGIYGTSQIYSLESLSFVFAGSCIFQIKLRF
ncbi:hypothetical protein U1Q18_006149 [Sarracenia purpurea var. burkii]